jgi:hypothetical protein
MSAVTETATDSKTLTFTEVMNSLKSLEPTELFKLLKAAATEAEKKNKPSKASTKSSSKKKTGSMPKGAVPPQLKKPRAWVDYTLKDALSNGWEAFTISQTHKDKETGEKITEEIEMPASILHNGAHVFDGSITEKTPDGKQLIHKEAMSLSKQRKESGHSTYAEFEASYVPDEDTSDEKSDGDSVSTAKVVVKKTAAEKEAEKEAAKAAKEAEKEAAKAAKEEEKAQKKAEKDAEKVAAKAAKEAEKTSKSPKATAKPVVKAATAPAPAAAAPKKTEAVPVKKQSVKAVSAVGTTLREEIPNDGMVHPWTHKGKKYLRNFEGETWTVGADGGVGDWAGLYDSASKKFDTSAPEPVFDDSEDEE